MTEDSKNISINPLVRSFYQQAKEYDDIDTQEVNPSMHALLQVNQRYLSAELIAEGGMKRIFKVYDARAKRHLAMAMLREDLSEDLIDPFIHEAWLTARLDHPNIITIHDVGVKAVHQPYFTMDLKQGFTLRELIEKLHSGDRKTRSRYPLESLLQMFLKICDAVSYAHSVNVVHLDLKPANIQIGEYGSVLVCDWGLGRVLGGDDPQELDRMLFNPDLLSSSNLYGQLKGTPGYMAPEQLVDAGLIDARSDVYGLGCILYSLLTYLRPLTGDDEEIIKRAKDGSVMPPVQRAPERHIPMGMDAVVMKALEREPARRYASVDEMRDEVNRYLTGFATEAENAGVFKQMSLFFQRNRRFCLTILFSLLVVTVGAVWSFHKLSGKERAVSEALDQAERTLGLYEAGQTELEILSYENSESIVKLAERYQFHGDYQRVEAMLSAVLENAPENKVICREMGVYYFICQEFNAALPYLERGISPKDDVHDAAAFYAQIKGDDEKLTASQLVDIINRMVIHEPLMLRMVLYDQRRRFDLEERALIVEAYLRQINPAWTDGWFEYDPVESYLRLGGKGLRQVSTQKSVLIGLNPRTLDLSGSDVEDLWKETDSAIEILDIRGTSMNTIWFLKRFVHLQELIITPGQLDESERKKIPARVRVVEKPLQ